MKRSHLLTPIQITRVTAISSTLSSWGDVYNLQETPQYRQRMHHSNPDKQCQKVDILYECGHLFPKYLWKQMSR
jgi:hypothetical protein